MIILHVSLIVLAYFAQGSIALQTCTYYPDSLANVIGMPTLCADTCCKTVLPKTKEQACCGSQNLGLWWIAIGCAIALVLCAFILICCCCGGCACKCLKCCFPCCD